MLDRVFFLLLGAFLILIPGFLLTLVLFPERGGLDFWERVGAGFGLGLLVVVYIGFILAKPGLLSAGPFILAFIAACAALALLAKWRGGLSILADYRSVLLRKLAYLKRLGRPSLKRPEERWR